MKTKKRRKRDHMMNEALQWEASRGGIFGKKTLGILLKFLYMTHIFLDPLL